MKKGERKPCCRPKGEEDEEYEVLLLSSFIFIRQNLLACLPHVMLGLNLTFGRLNLIKSLVKARFNLHFIIFHE